ncbi:MAG TPA: hypothetical protein VFJ05_04760 [Nitrososphaeraceae archaeon]|nr:hypothetical protein [Nitrososphaeraceae archaeon]
MLAAYRHFPIDIYIYEMKIAIGFYELELESLFDFEESNSTVIWASVEALL